MSETPVETPVKTRGDIVAMVEDMHRTVSKLWRIRSVTMDELLQLSEWKGKVDFLAKIRPNDPDVRRIKGLVTETLEPLNAFVDSVDDCRDAVEEYTKVLQGLLDDNPDEDEIVVDEASRVASSTRSKSDEMARSQKIYSAKLDALKEALEGAF